MIFVGALVTYLAIGAFFACGMARGLTVSDEARAAFERIVAFDFDGDRDRAFLTMFFQVMVTWPTILLRIVQKWRARGAP